MISRTHPIATATVVLLLGWALSAAAKDSDESAQSSAKPAQAAGALPAEAKQALDAAGLKVVGANLTLAGEGELAKLLADVVKQKKALIGAERELRDVEAEVTEIKEQVTARKVRHVELSAQLTQVQPGDTQGNNRIVGELNALSGQIDLGIQQQKAVTDRLKTAMAAARDARETYVEQVLNMRTLADGITEKWTQLAADPALQAAIASANDATGKKLKLAPSPTFLASEKKLEGLEHTVLSESIPMTDDGGSLSVTVTINGKHRKEMIVDSGATTMCLPYAMAKEMGIEPKSSDPKVTGILADGSEVEATRIKLASVRVGKFTVEDVDCDVFERQAVNAGALLGMSFLGNFKIEIDKQKSELRMVKVDSGDAPPKSKAGSGKSKPGGKSRPGGKSKPKENMDQ